MRTPELKEQWACEVPSRIAVWEDGENEFYSCPMRFVTSYVYEWYSEHAYCERYHTIELYAKQNERFVAALNTYNSKLSHFRAMALKQKRTE